MPLSGGPVLSGRGDFPGTGSIVTVSVELHLTYLTVAYRLNHPEVGYGRFPREL